MAKKSVKKGKTTKIVKEKTTIYKESKSPKKKIHSKKPLSDKEMQFALIENFVNLQKVLTNLSFKFDTLSNNINNLLDLYETAAKSFIEQTTIPGIEGKNDDKELLRKLDTLLDQNKTIAKGLTLIEEKIKHKVYGEETSKLDFSAIGRPKPRPLPKL